jgi:hypothetical protein
LGGQFVPNPIVIGEHRQFHGCDPCQLPSNACRMCETAVFNLHRNWFANALRSSGAGLGAVL